LLTVSWMINTHSNIPDWLTQLYAIFILSYGDETLLQKGL
jgi:hypothetical protein